MDNNKTNIDNVARSTKKDFQNMHFIRDIENLTGIKAYTLRVWEQRYNLLETKRSDTNIRYYDDDDLRFLISVGILNSNGIKISKIASMTIDEVQKKARVFSESQIKNDGVMQSLGAAMMAFDEKDFTKILSGFILREGMEHTMFDIIFPFLRHLGILWLDGSIGISHEHFVTNLIRKKLYSSIVDLNIVPNVNSRKYVLFVPSGETHNLSIIFAEYMLRIRGQQVFSLGESVPIDDLHTIVKEIKADVVFCSITGTAFSIPPQSYLKTLKNNFPKHTIMVTGNYFINKKLIAPDDLFIIESPHDLDKQVSYLEMKNNSYN